MSKMTKLKVVLFYLSLGMATAAVAGKTLFPGMQPIAEGALEYVDLKANLSAGREDAGANAQRWLLVTG